LKASIKLFASPIWSLSSAALFAAVTASLLLAPNCSDNFVTSAVASLSCAFKEPKAWSWLPPTLISNDN